MAPREEKMFKGNLKLVFFKNLLGSSLVTESLRNVQIYTLRGGRLKISQSVNLDRNLSETPAM